MFSTHEAQGPHVSSMTTKCSIGLRSNCLPTYVNNGHLNTFLHSHQREPCESCMSCVLFGCAGSQPSTWMSILFITQYSHRKDGREQWFGKQPTHVHDHCTYRSTWQKSWAGHWSHCGRTITHNLQFKLPNCQRYPVPINWYPSGNRRQKIHSVNPTTKVLSTPKAGAGFGVRLSRTPPKAPANASARPLARLPSGRCGSSRKRTALLDQTWPPALERCLHGSTS